MIASVIRFALPEDTDWDAMRRLARERAEAYYRDVPGLRSKAFIVSVEERMYGGLYTWERRAQLDAFLASEAFRGMVERLGEPRIEVYEVPAYVEQGVVVIEEPEASAGR